MKTVLAALVAGILGGGAAIGFGPAEFAAFAGAGDDHVGASTGQAKGHGAAQAASATGDDHYLAADRFVGHLRRPYNSTTRRIPRPANKHTAPMAS